MSVVAIEIKLLISMNRIILILNPYPIKNIIYKMRTTLNIMIYIIPMPWLLT